jgi:hypothetical protein
MRQQLEFYKVMQKSEATKWKEFKNDLKREVPDYDLLVKSLSKEWMKKAFEDSLPKQPALKKLRHT